MVMAMTVCECDYASRLRESGYDVILCGIAYDPRSKEHSCLMERAWAQGRLPLHFFVYLPGHIKMRRAEFTGLDGLKQTEFKGS